MAELVHGELPDCIRYLPINMNLASEEHVYL